MNMNIENTNYNENNMIDISSGNEGASRINFTQSPEGGYNLDIYLEHNRQSAYLHFETLKDFRRFAAQIGRVSGKVSNHMDDDEDDYYADDTHDSSDVDDGRPQIRRNNEEEKKEIRPILYAMRVGTVVALYNVFCIYDGIRNGQYIYYPVEKWYYNRDKHNRYKLKPEFEYIAELPNIFPDDDGTYYFSMTVDEASEWADINSIDTSYIIK